MAIGEELLSVPIGDLIRAVGTGIAEAQLALDTTSVQIARLMSGVDQASRIPFGKGTYSMLELGLTPTFYQFVDTIIEMKVSFTITRSSDSSTSTSESTTETRSSGGGFSFFGLGGGGSKTTTVKASSVNSSYSSKYSYSAEGSSLVRTKLVPVPPPSILTDRIRDLLEEEKKAAGTGLALPSGTGTG